MYYKTNRVTMSNTFTKAYLMGFSHMRVVENLMQTLRLKYSHVQFCSPLMWTGLTASSLTVWSPFFTKAYLMGFSHMRVVENLMQTLRLKYSHVQFCSPLMWTGLTASSLTVWSPFFTKAYLMGFSHMRVVENLMQTLRLKYSHVQFCSPLMWTGLTASSLTVWSPFFKVSPMTIGSLWQTQIQINSNNITKVKTGG